MRIEIVCPDFAVAYQLTQAAPPDGARWEPLPPVELDNEAPIHAKEVTEIIPTVIFLTVAADVATRVIAHFLIQMLDDLREKRKDRDKHEEPTIRVGGFTVEPNEAELARRIEQALKPK